MFCGCGIIIKWPKLLRGKEKKNREEEADFTAERPPNYASTVDEAVCKISDVDPFKVIERRRCMRSGGSSLEEIKETAESI